MIIRMYTMYTEILTSDNPIHPIISSTSPYELDANI